MSAVAKKIKKTREDQGITQQEMADALHITVKAWQKIEYGITRLDIDRLVEVSQALEISPMDLLNADEYFTSITQQYNKVGVANKDVIFNDAIGDSERMLFNQMIKQRDEEIERLRIEKEKDVELLRTDKDKEIAFLRDLLSKK